MKYRHRLSPLLEPNSVAVVGASTKSGKPGNNVVRMLKRTGFHGDIYPINPAYKNVEGLACYATASELPSSPDLAILSVSDTRVEAAFHDAIEAGAQSALIFGGANLEEASTIKLPRRLRDIAQEAEIPLMGANCMGFYNFQHPIVSTFYYPPHLPNPGHCTLITHSGSSWTSVTHNDERFGFNLSISTGQELSLTTADYIDFALENTDTRVIGLILETVRDPESFIAALEKANRKEIPVVALKVGRTEASAKLAISHSGAIAGNDAAYEAIFYRYGVSRVETLEELASALSLLCHYPTVGPGELISTHDSGFERELFVDLAERYNAPLANLTAATTAKLTTLLDPGLDPINPLDVWGTGYNYEEIFTETFCAMLDDPNAAIGIVSHSARNGVAISEAWLDTLTTAFQRTNTPSVLVTNFPWTHHEDAIRRAREVGFPIIDGMANGLVGVRCLFEQRDFKARSPIAAPPAPESSICEKWKVRLGQSNGLDEIEIMTLLEDFGIRTSGAIKITSKKDAIKAYHQLDVPVALKTAESHIHHKTEVNGVHLNLRTVTEVADAYADLANRLGPVVSIAPMITGGVEMSLGILGDRQFGPMVLISAGGTMIEIFADRRLSPTPLDERTALNMIETLGTRPLLDEHRGRPAVDIHAFAQAAVKLGTLADVLGDLISELDINPLTVTPNGAYALDALLVLHSHYDKN